MTPKMREDLADRAVARLERAQEAREAGRHDEALPLAREAARGFARAGGTSHPDHASARAEVGLIYMARGQPRAALPHLTFAARTLAASRFREPVVAEMAVHAALALATCLTDLARYDEARRTALAALRRARARLGPTHALVGAVHNRLGIIGKFSGRFDEAATHYRAARPILVRHHGAASREMATLWHNLGGLDHARGRFRRGEPPARRAVEIARKLLPPGDPELLAHEVAHAALLDGLGRFRESVAVYRRAVAAFTRRFGRVHYEVASTLHNLAAAEDSLGQRAAAIRHYDEALRLYRKLLGPGHPDEALTLHNLGLLRGDAALVRRAHTIFRRRLGGRHPHTVACAQALDNLAP